MPCGRLATSWRAWIVALSLVVTSLGVGPRGAGAQAAPIPPPVGLSVAIGIPGSPREVLVGQTVPVVVRARGIRDIATLELWANDELVATLPGGKRDTTAVSGWEWVPDAPGDVALFARGSDVTGTDALSNALHVRVIDGGGGSRATRRANDQAVGPASGEGAEDPGPSVDVDVDGCRLHLRPGAAPGGRATSIHHLLPSGVAFERVATLGAGDDVQVVELPVGPGLHVVSQSTLDAGSERYGAPVAVSVPARCGRVGWSGDVRLVDGRLRVPAAVDRGYLYLQVDGGPAVRVPADPASFVVARDGTLDFGPVLPRLDGEVLTIDVWGWEGSRLVDLGRGRLRMPKARAASVADPTASGQPGFLRVGALGMDEVLGFAAATTLDLVVQKGGGEFPTVLAREGALPFPTTPAGLPIPRTLRWTTNLADVTSVVWQVLPYPPGTAADLAPPFAIDLWSVAVPTGATSGESQLDFSLYLEHPVSVAQAAAGLPGQQPVILGEPWLPGLPTPTAPPGTVSQAAGIPGDIVATQAVPTPVAFVGDFYVRVVPMAGGTPLTPSNFVRLSVTEPTAPLQIDWTPCDTCTVAPGALQLSWSFTLPTPADPKYTACAVVTGFSPDYQKPPAIWPWTYAVGKVFCPTPPDDDWDLFDALDAAVGFVTKVWDFVSSTYDWVKQQVVALVLTAVPCQQIADDSVCEGIANVALDAVAVGFGVPPSIPDYSSTMQALKGDVVDFIVENAAEQFPAIALACDVASAGASVSDDLKDCRDLAALAVDEVVERIEAARSAAAGAATGKAWPGVLFAPDPRGQWQPPTLTITATRTGDPVQPKVCYVAGEMTSALADWEWPALVAGKVVQASGDVQGMPLQSKLVTLPPLAAGETVTRTIWLDRYATWFESKDSFEYWYYAKALANPNRAWVLLQQGAQLTFRVTSNCAPASSVGPVTLPASATGQ